MRSASAPGTFAVAPLGLSGESFSWGKESFSEVLECAIWLALQRVRKLQEQAAVSDDLVARFQPAGDLRLPVQTFSECHRTSAKLVRGCSGVNKRLVLGVAENCGIRKRNSVGDRARVYSRYNVHVFLEFFARIAGLDARLQRPRAGVK